MDAFAMTEFLLDDGIVLRRFRPDDAGTVYRVVADDLEHLRVYMHWAVPGYSLNSATEFIEASMAAAEENKSLGFGIFDGEQFIGSVGFVNFDHLARRTEIGYWIASRFEGKGIVTRCCRRLIEHAFNELGLNRIEIRCAVENVRSAAVARRLGFTREGVLRQSEMRNGRLLDFEIYGLLAGEWLPSGGTD